MKIIFSFLFALVLAGCGGPVTSSSETAPELTEAHHCGYGFYAGDADQNWALKVTFDDFEAAYAGEIPEHSDLSSDTWSAKLEGGEDLFANWCDDVLEPGEPTPEVSEVWEVSGDIEVTDLPDPGACGPATASLSGLEAHNDSGDVIPLGDFDVENEFWGCFAG
ncbi:MAG: hypothetical protein ACLFVZ_04870 [Actinomycetota bacterium]